MAPANRLEGKRVLLVDDEPDILETLEDLLPMCRTVRADSYEEACRQIDTENFDLAVLDIMGVSGYELLRRCVQKNIPAIMLTARALAPADVARSFQGGAAYFIPKEEILRLATFLEDVLEAQAAGKSTWSRWMERLSAFGEKTFEKDFDKNDPNFLDKLIFY